MENNKIAWKYKEKMNCWDLKNNAPCRHVTVLAKPASFKKIPEDIRNK